MAFLDNLTKKKKDTSLFKKVTDIIPPLLFPSKSEVERLFTPLEVKPEEAKFDYQPPNIPDFLKNLVPEELKKTKYPELSFQPVSPQREVKPIKEQKERMDFRDLGNMMAELAGGLASIAIGPTLSGIEAVTKKPLGELSLPLFKGQELKFRGVQTAYEQRLNAGQSAKEAFWGSTLELGIDLAFLVPIVRNLTKIALIKKNPQALVKQIEFDTQKVRDYVSGKIDYLGIPVPEELKTTFKSLTTQHKSEVVKGLAIMRDVKPSRLGQILGISEEEAKALVGAVRQKPAGLLPMEAGTIPEPKPAGLQFGLRGLEIQEFPAKKIKPFRPKVEPKPKPAISAEPLAQEARKAIAEGKTAEEFVEAQEKGVFYHGTSKESAQAIREGGFSLEKLGERAKLNKKTGGFRMLEGGGFEEIPHVERRGVSITPDSTYARRYANSLKGTAGRGEVLPVRLKEGAKLLPSNSKEYSGMVSDTLKEVRAKGISSIDDYAKFNAEYDKILTKKILDKGYVGVEPDYAYLKSIGDKEPEIKILDPKALEVSLTKSQLIDFYEQAVGGMDKPLAQEGIYAGKNTGKSVAKDAENLEDKESNKFREFNQLPLDEQEKAFNKLDPEDKEKVFGLESVKSNRDLIKIIKKLGGIKSFRGGFLSEELKPLPIIVRSKKGVTIDEMLDMLRNRGFDFDNEAELIDALTQKTTILKDKTFKPIRDEVVKNTKEYDVISEELKKRIKTFFTPSNKRKSRPFALLGNKDSTVDLFSFILDRWVQEHGIEVFIEPYAGAFTLGTHALENAINSGLKEYHGNVFDKEKFIIIKEIENGNVEKIKELLNKAPILLTREIRKHATGKQKEIFDNFFAKNSDSYIGSDAFLNYIRNLPEGSQVTVYKDVYEPWQKIFNAAYKSFIPPQISSTEDAIKKVLIHNTGIFSGTNQSLIRSQGFTSFENKLFGKFGTRDGFDDINRIFNLAKEKGVKVFIESKDGVDFINSINTKPIKTAYYLDPPYIKSSAVYSDVTGASDLEKFTDMRQFIESHRKVFDQMADGAQGAFTNDIVEEYLKDMESMIPDSKLFAYKEKNTPTSLVTNKETGELVDRFLVEYSNKERKTERPEIVKIKELKKEKQLSNLTVSRIRKGLGITELKNATKTQIDQLISFIEELKQGDKLLTPKQMEGLGDLVESAQFNNPLELITQREVQEKFRGKFDDIMGTGIAKNIESVFFPTVEIKEGNPIIKKVVDRGDRELDIANKEVERRNKKFSEMVDAAEKSRKLPLFEKFKRTITPQNKEIFQALSGERVLLTKEEAAVVAYLKNFFAKVKTDLNLSKYRKYYVPHLGQKFMEKVITLGPKQAILETFKTKDANIPLNIMLELDNIIGGKKFFKFALERKGGLIPTTNLRRIIHEYSNLYETKKALDRFLPEGQAVTRLLLKDKSAIWMKQFLQNIKGRGLDNKFRHGPMAWIPKISDRIIGFTYVHLLGLNYRSTIKNLIGGEVNSIVYQDFIKYLTGKKRAIENPKKLYRMATKFSIFEGTFSEYVEKGIGGLKKYSNILMVGQRAGEYEIRGTIFAAELTEQEWATEKISPEKIREIKDIISITQGLFTKVDTPLLFQTWYGRMFTQMNRWRVTNALLFRRILKGVIREQKAGIRGGVNTRRMGKMFLMYLMSLWVSYEFGKAGYKQAQKIARTGGELINNLVEIITLKAITDAISDNVTISTFKRITFDLQMLASYIHLIDEPSKLRFQSGLKGTYIAPIETGKRIFGIEKVKKKPSTGGFWESAPKKKSTGGFWD